MPTKESRKHSYRRPKNKTSQFVPAKCAMCAKLCDKYDSNLCKQCRRNAKLEKHEKKTFKSSGSLSVASNTSSGHRTARHILEEHATRIPRFAQPSQGLLPGARPTKQQAREEANAGFRLLHTPKLKSSTTGSSRQHLKASTFNDASFDGGISVKQVFILPSGTQATGEEINGKAVIELVNHHVPSDVELADLMSYYCLGANKGPAGENVIHIDGDEMDVHKTMAVLFPEFCQWAELKFGRHSADNPLYYLVKKQFRRFTLDLSAPTASAVKVMLLPKKLGVAERIVYLMSRYPIPKSVYGNWKAAINRAEIGEPDPIDIDKGKERAVVYSSESESEDDSDAASSENEHLLVPPEQLFQFDEDESGGGRIGDCGDSSDDEDLVMGAPNCVMIDISADDSEMTDEIEAHESTSSIRSRKRTYEGDEFEFANNTPSNEHTAEAETFPLRRSKRIKRAQDVILSSPSVPQLPLITSMDFHDFD
ncbi:hypothetical protein DL96DRAFT_1716170 [Flagelloscypha sp. PMI_526]|nr:hypothetical protein DL96DRAFT_1716170 [Flagelloscypha sp. PMI_526]